jgi:hypothetical protein
MKWLFLLLLIINIGIFTWGYQQEQLATKPPIAAGADVGNMRLVNELNKESGQTAIEPEPEPAKEEVAAETETAAVPEQQESSEKQTEDSTTEAKPDLEEDVTTAAADTKATTTPQIQAEVDRPVADGKAIEPKSETTSRCGAIGPIIDRQKAQKVLDELKKLKFEPRMEQSSKKHQIGYWVVIPHLAGSDQAKAVIEQLAQAGLKDIWHFRGGELENVISLGVFSKKENAENFSREVLAKGFKTEMQPRYLNKKHYMLKFNITRPKNVTGIMWRMVEKKYSKMPFTEQSCEPIATR